MHVHNLLSVSIGDSAVIDHLELAGTSKQRLLDLGLTPGTNIQCLYEAPSGDPKAYLIRGTVIALRNQDATKICLLAT